MTPHEHERMRGIEDAYWWYQALRHHVVALLSPPGENFSLLDSGCGTGGMLAAVREAYPGAALTGIDLSEHALALTHERATGARLICANANELPFPDGSFDAAVSLDILTHAGVDDAAALAELGRVLKPTGVAIVNVAAFEFLRGSHDVAVDVVRRYTKSQLRGKMEGAGFNLRYISYWNCALLPFVALRRWLSRRDAGDDEMKSDLPPVPSALNGTLLSLAASELALSRHFTLPYGTSIIALAEK